MTFCAHKIFAVILLIAAMTAGCVQNARTVQGTPQTVYTTQNGTDGTTEKPKIGLKSFIRLLAAEKQTKAAIEDLKNKNFDAADEKCAKQLNILDKLDIGLEPEAARAHLTGVVLRLETGCRFVQSKVAANERDWSRVVSLNERLIEDCEKGRILNPDVLYWEEIAANAHLGLVGAAEVRKDQAAAVEHAKRLREHATTLAGVDKDPVKWDTLSLLMKLKIETERIKAASNGNILKLLDDLKALAKDAKRDAKVLRKQAAGDAKMLRYVESAERIIGKFEEEVDAITDKDLRDLFLMLQTT